MNLVGAVPVSTAPAATGVPLCLRPAGTALPIARAGYREDVPGPVPVRLLPSSLVTLAIGVGDPITVDDPSGHPSRCAAVVLGPRDVATGIALAGRQLGVLLRCPPPVAYTLLGVPLRLVTSAPLDLADVLGPDLAGLTDRLGDARRWPDRFDVLDAWLRRRLADGPPSDPAVLHGWRSVRAACGRAGVEETARRLGWSRRHLVRRFSDQVGIPPRTAGRIARFERAAALLADPRHGLGRVAADAGYADQAHLTRDVRAVTGWTPLGLRDRLSGSRSFNPVAGRRP